MTKIQLEKEIARNNLNENKRHNQSMEGIEASKARSGRMDAETRRKTYNLSAQLMPYQKGDTLSKSLANAGSAAKSITEALKTVNSLNDWQWYFRDAQRMKDVASISLQHSYGYPISAFDTPSGYGFEGLGAPGALGLVTAFTLGNSQGATSAVQRAADQMFTFVNANTGRISDYEASDLMMVTLAFHSLNAYSEHLKRIYRVMSTTAWDNAFLPRSIIESLGVNYDNIKDNMQDFRAHINYLEDMKEKYLAVPGTTIGQRWAFEMHHIFKDGDSLNSQLYYYIPRHFFVLNLNDGATSLTPRQWINNTDFSGEASYSLLTLNDIRTYTEAMLSGFAGYTDYRIMKSDIFKAYGDSAKYHAQYVSENETIDIVRDPMALTQFANASILNFVSDEAATFEISQDSNGFIRSNPQLAAGGETVTSKPNTSLYRLINIQIDRDITPDESAVLVTEATRLTQIPGQGTSLSGPAASVICGAVMVAPSVGYLESLDAGKPYFILAVDRDVWQTGVMNEYGYENVYIAAFFGMLHSFNWAPQTYMLVSDPVNGTSRIQQFNIDRYYILDQNRLLVLNQTIALHLFGGSAIS